MFSTSRKSAQNLAQQLISGHFTLVAWWTLRHAGIFEAMDRQFAENGEGLNPLVHATRSNMAPEVLTALFDYLAGAGLIAWQGGDTGSGGGGATFTAEGKALLENEDGVLELMRAYQPVLDMSEHLLAKLKTYGPPGSLGTAGGGVYRKSEYLFASQAQRYGREVFPEIQELVARHNLTHLLDLACGTGELMIYLAQALRKVVGVGITPEAAAVRQANGAFTTAGLEKRLIAVAAHPLEAITDTQRTFERIGISRQLWQDLDGLVAINVFSELAAVNGNDPVHAITTALSGARKYFPKAKLLVVEPVESPRLDKNYYAPEWRLLLRLTRSSPWTVEKWRELFVATRWKVEEEAGMATDGLVAFLCG